jgi:hypothetical protein
VGAVTALERNLAIQMRPSIERQSPPSILRTKTARSIADAQQRRSWPQLRQVDTVARPLLMEQNHNETCADGADFADRACIRRLKKYRTAPVCIRPEADMPRSQLLAQVTLKPSIIYPGPRPQSAI